MSLPPGFSSPSAYFTAALEFLQEFSWIYQNANTCYLKNGVLDQMPIEFQDYFLHLTNEELNKFPMLFQPLKIDDKYEKVAKFRNALKILIPEESFEEPKCQETKIDKKLKSFQKMNPKKRHEISRLSYLITSLHKGNEVLIDFGSGLGYLSEILHHHHGSHENEQMVLLGLEADEYRVMAAKKRQMEFMPKTLNNIEYKKEFISFNSKGLILETFKKLVRRNEILNPKMFIIGLHSCGDLTITSMNLFLTMENVTKLAIISCCYHKMELLSKEDEQFGGGGVTFRNFPLSESLKTSVANVLKGKACGKILNRPFLRLACQQTTARWFQSTESEHRAHASEMFWRAFGECLLQPGEQIVKKNKRLSLKDCEIKDFQDFSKVFLLKNNEILVPWTKNHEKDFHYLKRKHVENGLALAEILTCLQTSIQKLCENLVLYDRLCYMREFSSKENLNIDVSYQKILNEQLSPRCYALIAKKL